MKLLTWLMMAQAAAGQAPAPPPAGFCRDLERVVEAAARPGGFDALEIARPNPPDFGFLYGCGRSGDARQAYWLCTQNLAPESLGHERLAANVTACRPDAQPLPTEHRGERRFRLPHAEVRIFESGGPRAHVGRMVSFVVAADPAK